jgi:hypothetical protein
VVCFPGEDGLTVPVADLVLVGEVLSSASRFVDLVWKRKLYAEAARSEAGVLKLERPFPVTIELSP